MSERDFWSGLGEFAYELRAMGRLDSELVWFLLEASPLQLQRTFLWLSHFPVPRESEALVRASRRLRTCTTAELLQSISPDLTGCQAILRKMGKAAWSRAQYLNLTEQLKRQPVRRVLAHMGTVRPDHLEAIRTFGPSCFDAELLSGLSTPASMRQATGALVALQRLCERYGELRDRLTKNGQWYALSPSTVKTALRNLGITPPFAFDDTCLTFLASWDDFRKTGRRMRNCIADNEDYWKRSLLGTHAYFVWEDVRPAMVEVQNDPLIGWHLQNALGSSNAELPEEDLARLIGKFAEFGVPYYPTIPAENIFLDEICHVRRRRFL